MNCEYCQAATHVVVDCPQRKSDRRLEVTFGCFIVLILGPFYIVGAVAGAVWGALRAGFQAFSSMWPSAWKQIRGKKQREGNGNGDGETH